MSLDAFLMLSLLGHEVAEFADCYSTNIALTCGKNIFTEGNAISKWLINKIGLQAMYVIKMGVLPIGITVLGILVSSAEVEALWANVALAGVIGTIGVLNLIKIKKAGISIALF